MTSLPDMAGAWATSASAGSRVQDPAPRREARKPSSRSAA
jgi:hypothetical protein